METRVGSSRKRGQRNPFESSIRRYSLVVPPQERLRGRPIRVDLVRKVLNVFNERGGLGEQAPESESQGVTPQLLNNDVPSTAPMDVGRTATKEIRQQISEAPSGQN